MYTGLRKKYDILVFGMPQKFHYGDGMGTNPIMLMQALSAQVLRFKRVMSDHCVIIFPPSATDISTMNYGRI